MLRKLRRRLSFANVTSLLALFVALGGTGAYAANEWNSSNIQNETLLGADVRGSNGSPTSTGINGSLTGADISGQPAIVDSDQPFVNGSLTSYDIATNTLTGDDVRDNALKGADIDESTLTGLPGGGIGPPEAWHAVQPGSTTTDRCADPATVAVFCSTQFASNFDPWENYGAPYTTAAFYKDQLGIVHLKGLVKKNTLEITTNAFGRPIFRLPAAYRPATAHVFASVGENHEGAEVVVGRVDVLPDGIVRLVVDCDADLNNCSANGPHVTLDGITFRPSG
jgi:hypothetical protein